MTSHAPAAAVLALPQSPLAAEALALVYAHESAPIANHSIRSYLFARLVAAHRGAAAGVDYDDQLLLLACVLHDMGLTERGNRDQRFEVDGADTAAEFLTERGLPAAEVDLVWEAIALHTSFGIAERRRPICQLTSAGIGMDFGAGAEIVSAEDAEAIHAAYPRLSMASSLADAIVGQAHGRPEKAPPYTLTANLLRERAEEGHPTLIEQLAGGSRWGN
jgi:hypothetical protein